MYIESWEYTNNRSDTLWFFASFSERRLLDLRCPNNSPAVPLKYESSILLTVDPFETLKTTLLLGFVED
jgi:hypothetical protein